MQVSVSETQQVSSKQQRRQQRQPEQQRCYKVSCLCSAHHRLVHEGGYRIRRGADDELYFERPDGRVIPKFGYRVADTEPDPAILGDTSAEGWLTSVVHRARGPDVQPGLSPHGR